MRWYKSVILASYGALLADAMVAQQDGLVMRTERVAPAPAFNGDLAKLAVTSPAQPVNLQVDFVSTTSIDELANLIFAERVTVGCPAAVRKKSCAMC